MAMLNNQRVTAEISAQILVTQKPTLLSKAPKTNPTPVHRFCFSSSHLGDILGVKVKSNDHPILHHVSKNLCCLPSGKLA